MISRNLQIANHVVFLASMAAKSQYKYDSTLTQAVGRVLRCGQEKDVHVYYFLAAQTIDVNILQQRTGQILALRDEQFLLLDESEIHKDDKLGWAGVPFEGAACSAGDTETV